MSSSKTFILNDQIFDYKLFKDHFLDLSKNTFLTPFEQNTLFFIHRWLNEEPYFPIRTSGSTGTSKELLLDREQMRKSARLTGEFFSFSPGMKSLVCLNTSYIAGMMMLVRSMEYGMAMTITEPSSDPLKDFPPDTAFDFAAFVPLQPEAILQNLKSLKILNRMRTVLVGGAPLSPTLTEKLRSVRAPVFHSYGMTETVSHIALRRVSGEKIEDFYTVLPETIIDRDERGCLTIISPVTNGEKVITNDLAEILSPKTFRWLGRIDRVINSGGVKINLEETEQKIAEVLARKNKIWPFFLHPVNDERLGQTSAFVAEAEKLTDEDITFLKQVFKTSLHPYEAPRAFYFIREFLRTPTGKIDRPTSFKAAAGLL